MRPTWLLLAFCLSLSPAALEAQTSEEMFGDALGGAVVEGVAAVVGDEVILLSEVEREVLPVIARAQASGQAVPRDVIFQVRRDALQTLIDEKIILEMAERMNLQTSPEEIDHILSVKAEEEGVSVEALYQQAEQNGLGRDQYRDLFANQIVKMRVLQTAVQSRVQIPEEEIRALYEKRYGSQTGLRARVQHILLPWGGDPPEMVLERAAELREKAENGSEFGMLAREYSATPYAAGGGYVTFVQGEVAPELGEYAFALPTGSISPPIETMHGANLIKVIERYDPAAVKFEDVQTQLYAEIADKKMQPEFRRWLDELREQKYIAIIDPALK